MQIGFRWNPIFGTIEKQANEQGFTLGKDAEKINDYQENLFCLHMDRILTDSQYDKILQKLHKHTVDLLEPLGEKELFEETGNGH